jgi:hypothetical protein
MYNIVKPLIDNVSPVFKQLLKFSYIHIIMPIDEL